MSDIGILKNRVECLYLHNSAIYHKINLITDETESGFLMGDVQENDFEIQVLEEYISYLEEE